MGKSYVCMIMSSTPNINLPKMLSAYGGSEKVNPHLSHLVLHIAVKFNIKHIQIFNGL